MKKMKSIMTVFTNVWNTTTKNCSVFFVRCYSLHAYSRVSQLYPEDGNEQGFFLNVVSSVNFLIY